MTTRPSRRRPAALLVAVTSAAAVLTGCGSGSVSANGTAGFGAKTSGSASATTASPSESSPMPGSSSPSSAASAKPSRSATTTKPTSGTGQFSGPTSPEAARQTGSCTPSQVTVPSVSIDEPVAALGLDRLGQINPPPHTTMWYTGSPHPGSAGISVIAGHVTYDGPDNFYNLDRVPVGARVTVRCVDRAPLTLRVTHKESEQKTAVQRDARVWGQSSSPVVVLITCDRNSPMIGRHHTNNYVVWTVPVN